MLLFAQLVSDIWDNFEISLIFISHTKHAIICLENKCRSWQNNVQTIVFMQKSKQNNFHEWHQRQDGVMPQSQILDF